MNRLVLILILLAGSLNSFAQEQVIDEIVGVVGSKIILKSDIENQYTTYIAQGNQADDNLKCRLFEQTLLSKLLLNQAILDSVEVSDEQVDSELDKKIRFYIGQIGSQERLEEYFKKSLVEIKAEYRDQLKELLQTQAMQSKITKEITVSPSDVRDYYSKIPADSLPNLNAEIEVAQILKKVPENKEENELVKKKLEEIRQRILKGEQFSTLAVLYSEDATSKKGGDLGFTSRGELVPEFESIAFSLKPNEVSNIVQTQYGFHIIQLIERRGNQVNCRHILLKPKVTEADMNKTKEKLDSVYALLQSGKLSFTEAAQKYSQDDESKNNGGVIVNPQTGSTKFEADQMDPALSTLVDRLKVGEYSQPVIAETGDGKKAYRIVMLKSRIDAHKANLKDDYQKIQNAALNEKQSKALRDWVQKKRAMTFIQINETFKDCPAAKEWSKKNN